MSRTLKALLVATGTVALLGGCSEVQFLTHAAKEVSQTPVEGPTSASLDVENGTHYKVGNPYQINGVWYYPRIDYAYVEEGIASWYGPNFHGKPTANGATFDMNKVSAAHRTLPLPSIVRVTNLENGRSIKVKVNDRGPYSKNRIIDLSRRAAQLLGFINQGTALVRVELVEDESRQLAAYMRGETLEAPGEAPPPPEAAPTVAVSGSTLEPPPGTVASEPVDEAFQVAAKPEPSIETSIARADLPESSSVAVVQPVPAEPIAYVQAGAFSQFVNAQRAQIMLSDLGDVHVEQIMTSSQPLFRIRVGPARTAVEADRLLSMVHQAGYPDAHIVVAN